MTKGWLIGGAAFLGALLIASIVVALLDTEETLPEGTPEAAVQQFFRATQAEDYQIAYGFLGSDLRGECTVDRFVSNNNPSRFNRPQDSRIILKRTSELEEDVALVSVEITQFYGRGPFGSNESTFEQSFTLRKEDGEWRFTQYPWPFFNCGPFQPRPVSPAVSVEPRPTSTPEPEPDDDSEQEKPAAP